MAVCLLNDSAQVELCKFINRYDIDELVDAAHGCEDWGVIITKEEKEAIESRSSKNERKALMRSVILADGLKTTRFASFLLRYNEAVQNVALAVINGTTPPRAPETRQPGKLINRTVNHVLSGQRSSSTSSASSMEIDSVEPVTATTDGSKRAGSVFPSESYKTGFDFLRQTCVNKTDSQGSSSMDFTDCKREGSSNDKLSSQDGDSSSQDENESDDRGYYSLSKTDSSQNQSGSASIQPLQDNLTVIQKNHRSNRRKALRESSTLLKQQRKAQKNYIQVNYYVSSLGDEEGNSMLSIQAKDWPPLLKAHCQTIIENLNMEMLTPHLIGKDLLTRGEYEQLSEVTPRKQSEWFVLRILPSKGSCGFTQFLECLRDEKEHMGHQDLVQLLDKANN